MKKLTCFITTLLLFCGLLTTAANADILDDSTTVINQEYVTGVIIYKQEIYVTINNDNTLSISQLCEMTTNNYTKVLISTPTKTIDGTCD